MPAQRALPLLFTLVLACGLARSGLNQPPPSGRSVLTLGKPARDVASGDVSSPMASVSGLAFSRDNGSLLVARVWPARTPAMEAGHTEVIEVWKLSPLHLLRTMGSFGVYQAELAPNGKLFACLGARHIQLWDWQAGRMTADIDVDAFRHDTHTLEDFSACFQTEPTFSFLSDSTLCYTGMKHKRLMRLDTATGETQPTDLKFPENSAVTVSADGKMLCAAMYQESGFPDGLALYDVKSPALIRTLPLDTAALFGLLFFPDGKRLLTLEGDRCRVVDLATGKVLYSLPAHPDRSPAAISPNGRLLATVEKNSVSVWKAATGTKIAEWPSPSHATALAFAPDGRRLAIGYTDSTIKLWTLPSLP